MFNLHPDWLLRRKAVIMGSGACRQTVLRKLLLLSPGREAWPRAKGGGLLHPIRLTAPRPRAAESYLCSSFHPPRPQSRHRRNRRCRSWSWRSRSDSGARGRLTGALQGGETRWELVGGGKRIRKVEKEIIFFFCRCVTCCVIKTLHRWQNTHSRSLQWFYLNEFNNHIMASKSNIFP